MENDKRTYQAPELKEWGSVAEMTKVAVNDSYCGSVVDDCNPS